MVQIHGRLIERILKYNSFYYNMGFDNLIDEILHSDDADMVEDCVSEICKRKEILRACNKRMNSYSSFYLKEIVPFVDEAIKELLTALENSHPFNEAKSYGWSDYDSFHLAFTESFRLGEFKMTDNFLIHYNYFEPVSIKKFLDEMNYHEKKYNLFISVTDSIREPADFFLNVDISPLCLNNPKGFVVVGKKEFEDFTMNFLDY